jgi:hypothetical protein
MNEISESHVFQPRNTSIQNKARNRWMINAKLSREEIKKMVEIRRAEG